MARVTVEDCIVKIPNRFELVLIAGQRARDIGAGAAMLVPRDNDKNPVVALREIADTEISLETLKDALVRNHQKVLEVEDNQEDVIDIMEGETEWTQAAVDAAATELEETASPDMDFNADEGDIADTDANDLPAGTEDGSDEELA